MFQGKMPLKLLSACLSWLRLFSVSAAFTLSPSLELLLALLAALPC